MNTPAWDTPHPGRFWAERVQRPNDKSAEEIAAEVAAYLKAQTGFK